MRRRSARVTFVSFLCLTLLLPSERARSSQENGDDVAQNASAGEITIGLRVPTPISSDDLQRWSRLLDLSDEQLQYVHWCYERYKASADELFSQALPQIRKLGQTGGAAQYAQDGWLWADSANQLNEKELDLVERVRLLDLEFLSEMQRVLAEPQREQWPRIENRRRRDRTRCLLTYASIPASNVDLTSALYELGLTLDEVAEVDDIVLEYEIAVDSSWSDLVSATTKGRDPEVTNLFASLMDSNTTGSKREEAVRQYYQQTSMFSSDLARLSRRVVDLNDEHLKRIMGRLPADRAEHIKRAYYKERYFGFAYYDPLNPDWLLNRIVELPALDEEQRSSVVNAIVSFRQKYEALCEKIRLHYLDESEAFIRTYSTNESAKYDEMMDNARRERLELCKRTVNQIVNMLPSEAIAAIEKDLKRYRASLRQSD